MLFILIGVLFLASCSISSPTTGSSPKPIVLWHGMGDSCCNPLSLGAFKTFLEQEIPNVYVKSIQIGSNIVEDTENGFFKNANKQVEMVCEQLAEDSELTNGYNAIGFSQGAQFLRAVAQRCPSPQMYNLISLGGQHQGVFGLPHCFHPVAKVCDYIRRLLNIGAYWGWVQNALVQAEYWHDPLNESKYRKKSGFIAEINNEQTYNATYKENLLKLENLVLVKFLKDTMIQPKDSSWFEFYKPGQDENITPLNQSEIYLKDYLGLKKLYESDRLHFLGVEGDHLQFSETWFKSAIIDKYLV